MCDHMYIDLNAIVHVSLRGASKRKKNPTMRDYILDMFRQLDQVLRKCQPQKSLVLALDGTAPYAKLTTQRRRRQAEILKFDPEGLDTSPLAITPGTPLMRHIRDALQFYAASRLLNSGPLKDRDTAVVISGSDAWGEGELKMVDIMIETAAMQGGKGRDTHVMVGNDADLIVMSVASLVDNVYVMMGTGPRFRFLSTTKLLQALQPCTPKGSSAHLDFAALAIFTGNDYLPRLPGTTLPRMWALYQQLGSVPAPGGSAGRLFTKEGGLHLKAVLEFMDACAGASIHGDPPELPGSKDIDVAHYLQGVLWNVQMYVNGQCPAQPFVYDAMAPSPRRIANWCREQLAHPPMAPLQAPRSSVHALSPSESLVALLPRAAKALLPQALHRVTHDPELAALYTGEGCPECPGLKKQVSSSSQKIATVRRAHNTKGLNDAATEGSELLLEARRRHRMALEAYTGHVKEAHPQVPIPWDCLPRCVAAVPISELSESEQANVATLPQAYGIVLQRGATDKHMLQQAWQLPVSSSLQFPAQPSKLFRPLKHTQLAQLACRGMPRMPARMRHWRLVATCGAVIGNQLA